MHWITEEEEPHGEDEEPEDVPCQDLEVAREGTSKAQIGYVFIIINTRQKLRNVSNRVIGKQIVPRRKTKGSAVDVVGGRLHATQ